MANDLAPRPQPPPTLPAEFPKDVVPKELSKAPQGNPYHGIASVAFPREVQEILQGPIDPLDVEIKPNTEGIVYLPEIKYRRILNRAFGAGAWAMMPRSEFVMKDNTMSREYALFVHGRFVAEARGEQDYQANNPETSEATATEGVKSNAIMRCCKDLGIASELWDPNFIHRWKADYAVKVFLKKRDGTKTVGWRRKDRAPFWNETGIAPEDGAAPSREPIRPPEAKATAAVISDAQRKRLWAIANDADVADDTVKKYLKETLGITTSTELLVKDYDAVVAWVEAQKKG